MWLRALSSAFLLASCAGCADNSGFEGKPPSTGGGGSATGGQGGAGATGGVGGVGGTGGVVDDMCEQDPCKLVIPQCGCAEGLKCTVNSTERICTQDGTQNEGEQCSDTEGCKAGFLCVQTKTDVPTISTCMEFCSDDTQCEGAGGICNVTLDGISGVILCSQSCDPVEDTGCPVNKTHCEVVQEAAGQKRTYTRCVGEGASVAGDPCASSQDCTSGHGCLLDPNQGGLVCLEWCKVGGAACAQGLCTSINPPYLVDAVEYGVCL